MLLVVPWTATELVAADQITGKLKLVVCSRTNPGGVVGQVAVIVMGTLFVVTI